jgi:soluble lytic murein transglycosylase-like protein
MYMGLSMFRYIPLLVMVSPRLPAADPTKPAAPATAAEGSISQQRQAISAMEKSLEAQRQAIRKQTEQLKSQPFFLLPPPARTPLVAAPAADCDPLAAAEVDSLVGQAAKREEVDAGLLRSVIQQESGFRPCAVSAKGAMGLMQLMPATATQLGVDDPFNPKQNVDAGARFLKQLLANYAGDVPLALAAYNAGSSKVSEAGGIPFIPETVDYVRRVMLLLPPIQ